MKIKKLLIVISTALMLSLTGCASFSNGSHQMPKEGSVLDATTTYIALSGGATELNPLISWGSPATAALTSVGLKYGVKYLLIENAPEDAHEDYAMAIDTFTETAGVAASAWNIIAVIAGAHPMIGFAGAVVSGASYFIYKDETYKEMKDNGEL